MSNYGASCQTMFTILRIRFYNMSMKRNFCKECKENKFKLKSCISQRDYPQNTVFTKNGIIGHNKINDTGN